MAKRQPIDKSQIAIAIKTRCVDQGCLSTERSAYYGHDTKEIAGTDAQGNPYTHVVWAYTRCVKCGQLRKDRWTENRTGKQKRAA